MTLNERLLNYDMKRMEGKSVGNVECGKMEISLRKKAR